MQTKALGNDSNYKAVASPKLSPKDFAAFVKDDLDLLESESKTTDGANQNNDSVDRGKKGDSDQSTEESNGSIQPSESWCWTNSISTMTKKKMESKKSIKSILLYVRVYIMHMCYTRVHV